MNPDSFQDIIFPVKKSPSESPTISWVSCHQLVQLPPCIAGQVKAVVGNNQLAIEELPLDDIPDVAVSDLSDR